MHSLVTGSAVAQCLTRGFEPHRRHCVVSLSKTHLPKLSTGSTQEDPSLHIGKIVDGTQRIESNKFPGQIKERFDLGLHCWHMHISLEYLVHSNVSFFGFFVNKVLNVE